MNRPALPLLRRPPVAHRRPLPRFLSALFLVAAALLWLAAPMSGARADQQDIAAVARSVVRVVIIATDGEHAYFVGHGSGFAVAPDKVLTNAHVVELLRTEKNLAIGIIPSEGKASYGGRIAAYSPGNDLALVQMKEGRLPVSTFFAGAVSDGQHVTAIGYPAAVDRAQGLNLDQLVKPLSPVKTSGTVSMGRASHDFDTLLHTAPMAQGNSGGPLVDDCGRVLGVNSFGSEAESDADAEFGFAVSNREVASFLRQAGVPFQHTTVACRSIADLNAEEDRLSQEKQAKQDEQDRIKAAAHDKALAAARDSAEQDILTRRENAVAVAGLLLLGAGLTLGAAMMFHVQGKERQRLWAGIGGGALLLGAIAVFLTRPSFSDIDSQIALSENAEGNGSAAAMPARYDARGGNLCHIDENRSRITVSTPEDVALNWNETGCANGNTQYLSEGGRWTRIMVQPGEAAITVNSFDPATGGFRMDRYLPDDATMARAREFRARFVVNGCSAGEAMRDSLQQMQTDIRAILPAEPNERLVYQCAKDATGKSAANAGAGNAGTL